MLKQFTNNVVCIHQDCGRVCHWQCSAVDLMHASARPYTHSAMHTMNSMAYRDGLRVVNDDLDCALQHSDMCCLAYSEYDTVVVKWYV